MDCYSFLQDQAQSSQSNVGVDLSRSDSYDHARQLASELAFKSSSTTASENRCLIDFSNHVSLLL